MRSTTAALLAVSAAALYAINIPFSKILLAHIPPTLMAAFLYLGAGLGLALIGLFRRGHDKANLLTVKELPYTLGMIVLDICAPIFLMLGLERCSSANASLLNNFEIVATSLIAFFVFREKISKRLSSQQCASAVDTHISSPSRASLPPFPHSTSLDHHGAPS